MGWQKLSLDRIYFDSITGVPGTTWPIGTPTVPSDVIADVITMCAARNIRDIDVHGILVLGATMNHYCFIGHCHESATDTLSLNTQDVDDSRFDNCTLTGAQAGAGLATYMRCILYNTSGIRGMLENCAIFGTLAVATGGADFVDFDHCTSVHGVITVTIGDADRVSFKDFKGGMILTGQAAGSAVLVRGISGYLEVDAMVGGTLDIYADAADIQINANCSAPAVINIYGNARVTVLGGTATVNDYTQETQLDDIEASAGRALFTMDFWSLPQEEVAIPAAPAADQPLPSVTVGDLPGGATIVRAIAMFKFRMVENSNAAANKLSGAQEIQIAGSVDAINFVADQFTLAAKTREGGDVIIGVIDIATTVTADGAYAFHWDLALADVASLLFNDVQVGLRIWYSV